MRRHFSSALFPVLILLTTGCSDVQNSEQQSRAAEPEAESQSFDYRSFVDRDYIIDDQHSYLGFRINYFGYSPVRGRFDEFEGNVFYDPEFPENTLIDVVVFVESINTGQDRRDNDLISEDSWFDATTFPHMRFTSKRVELNEDSGLTITGDLEMKGVVRKEAFVFDQPTAISRDWASNEQVDFAGTAVINRQDYGVYGGDFWSTVMEKGVTQLSDEVEIEINAHCRRADHLIRYADMDSTDVRKVILDDLLAGSNDTAYKKLEVLDEQGQLSPGKLSSIGNTLNDRQMHEEALNIFEMKIDRHPDLPAGYIQKGITLMLMNKVEEAQACFGLAMERDSPYVRTAGYSRLMKKIVN